MISGLGGQAPSSLFVSSMASNTASRHLLSHRIPRVRGPPTTQRRRGNRERRSAELRKACASVQQPQRRAAVVIPARDAAGPGGVAPR
jgi:polyphosphate kinase 2 (PPK2 family)